MAKTKQYIVTAENRPGAVAEIARTLGNAKVNILSLLLLGKAEETRGAVQLVVDDARRAKKALDESGKTWLEKASHRRIAKALHNRHLHLGATERLYTPS